MLLKTPAELVAKLANTGGVIVGTNKLTELGIAEARAQGRMFVTEDGLGFVVLPNDVPHPTATSRALQQLKAAKQRELELLAVIEAMEAVVGKHLDPHTALREHEAKVANEILDAFPFFQSEEELWLADAIEAWAEERRKK